MGFRSQFESLVALAERWSPQADFYMVYGQEAFPEESSWPAPVPDGAPVAVPATLEERLALVERFAEGVGAQLPFLVDGVDNVAMERFDAYPFRVYAFDPGGRVAVPSDKGANGFAPTLERIEAWLQTRGPQPGSEVSNPRP